MEGYFRYPGVYPGVKSDLKIQPYALYNENHGVKQDPMGTHTNFPNLSMLLNPFHFGTKKLIQDPPSARTCHLTLITGLSEKYVLVKVERKRVNLA